jgi:hypothetical protein
MVRAPVGESRMKKKKPKPFRAVKAVKSLARERLGAPPPTRRLPDVNKKDKPKHKPTLGKLLSEE